MYEKACVKQIIPKAHTMCHKTSVFFVQKRLLSSPPASFFPLEVDHFLVNSPALSTYLCAILYSGHKILAHTKGMIPKPRYPLISTGPMSNQKGNYATARKLDFFPTNGGQTKHVYTNFCEVIIFMF